MLAVDGDHGPGRRLTGTPGPDRPSRLSSCRRTRLSGTPLAPRCRPSSQAVDLGGARVGRARSRRATTPCWRTNIIVGVTAAGGGPLGGICTQHRDLYGWLGFSYPHYVGPGPLGRDLPHVAGGTSGDAVRGRLRVLRWGAPHGRGRHCKRPCGRLPNRCFRLGAIGTAAIGTWRRFPSYSKRMSRSVQEPSVVDRNAVWVLPASAASGPRPPTGRGTVSLGSRRTVRCEVTVEHGEAGADVCDPGGRT